MARHPWEAAAHVDYDLDTERARRRIARRFPAFPLTTIRYFAEGWDFRNFLVNDAWLFRFPKRPDERERLAMEVELLRLLAGRLPLAIPRYEYVASDVVGYRLLPGRDLRGGFVPASFARDFGSMLAALHGIPPGDMADAVLRDQMTDAAPRQARARVLAHLAEAGTGLDAKTRARCQDLLAAPPAPYAGPPRVAHTDLFPEHVLSDGDRVTAFIDWGDAGWGDPAGDFALAWFLGADPLLAETLKHYNAPVDPGMPARARFFGACMVVSHLAFGTVAGRAAAVAEGRAALARVTASGDPTP